MTNKEENELVVRIVKKVLPFLGQYWAIDQKWLKEPGHGIRIVNLSSDLVESYKAIFFRLLWNKKDRLVIDGSFSYGGNGLSQFLPYTNREKTEITVKADTKPERIAKAINNRLMPSYEKMLRHCLEGKQKHDEYHDNKTQALERVAKAYGKGAEVRLDNDKNASEVHAYRPFSFSAKYYCNEIKMEIELPLDKAIEVLNFIRGKRKRRRLV